MPQIGSGLPKEKEASLLPVQTSLLELSAETKMPSRPKQLSSQEANQPLKSRRQALPRGEWQRLGPDPFPWGCPLGVWRIPLGVETAPLVLCVYPNRIGLDVSLGLDGEGERRTILAMAPSLPPSSFPGTDFSLFEHQVKEVLLSSQVL